MKRSHKLHFEGDPFIKIAQGIAKTMHEILLFNEIFTD